MRIERKVVVNLKGIDQIGGRPVFVVKDELEFQKFLNHLDSRYVFKIRIGDTVHYYVPFGCVIVEHEEEVENK